MTLLRTRKKMMRTQKLERAKNLHTAAEAKPSSSHKTRFVALAAGAAPESAQL